MNTKIFVFLALASIFPVQAQTFSSGLQQVALIELYTSEGCSSCPPADRWLSNSKNDPALWRQFVPIALHVDYWDRLGWRDIFAEASHSARQRQYAHVYSEPTVYTPGVRINGAQWRAWRSATSPAQWSDKEVGSLSLTVSSNLHFNAQWTPVVNKTDLAKISSDTDLNQPILSIALLGMGVESTILKGENAGRRLTHDFVVLGLRHYRPTTVGSFQGQLTRPSTRFDLSNVSGYAVAAWVSQGSTINPVQAVGGYIDVEF